MAAIVLLVLTYFGGVTINGATSWFRFGPIQLQTSEFVKTMTILFIAFAFSNPSKIFYKLLNRFFASAWPWSAAFWYHFLASARFLSTP